MIDTVALRARLADVRARIARAAGRAGRDPASIRLVAISKTFPADYVSRRWPTPARSTSARTRSRKRSRRWTQTADLALRWHLVGHLQSNKAKKAGRFDVVHSIDAARAGRKARRSGGWPPDASIDLLVQVDLAGEATKHGAREEELLAIFDAARARRAPCASSGLMLLPPAVDDPEGVAAVFPRAARRPRAPARRAASTRRCCSELSMGMSHDFEVAVEEGATLVRVGTAIFGSRTYPYRAGAKLIAGLCRPDRLRSDKPERGERSRMNVSPLDLRQQRFRTDIPRLRPGRSHLVPGRRRRRLRAGAARNRPAAAGPACGWRPSSTSTASTRRTCRAR